MQNYLIEVTDQELYVKLYLQTMNVKYNEDDRLRPVEMGVLASLIISENENGRMENHIDRAVFVKKLVDDGIIKGHTTVGNIVCQLKKRGFMDGPHGRMWVSKKIISALAKGSFMVGARMKGASFAEV